MCRLKSLDCLEASLSCVGRQDACQTQDRIPDESKAKNSEGLFRYIGALVVGMIGREEEGNSRLDTKILYF